MGTAWPLFILIASSPWDTWRKQIYKDAVKKGRASGKAVPELKVNTFPQKTMKVPYAGGETINCSFEK